MLSAPSAFKPTLASEYFFLNDPASPLPSSSPDIDQSPHAADKLMPLESILPPHASDDVLMSSDSGQMLPAGAAHEHASVVPSGSPSAAVSPNGKHASDQAQRVRQVLMDAAMTDSMASESRRSSTSTTSSAASSVAPSNSNSPHSPPDALQTGSGTFAEQIPSPPPLSLPQPATPSRPASSNITPPSSASPHYRSVPPAIATSAHASPMHTPPRDHSQRSSHPMHNDASQTVAAITPTQAAPAPRPLIGRSEGVEYVGPFVLGPVLGRGCTGTVRVGTHRRTGFEVAFKIIEKRYLASDPKLWAKVKREIVILKLVEHPHVLRLYDVLETENKLYLVLERVRGGELFDYIVSKGRLDRHESLRIAAQIIMGLQHCHQLSIAHRDLKPENLLLDENHNIKIADFGMAQLIRKDGVLKTSCGSPHYASPEVISGGEYDPTRSDVWSLGVILFALITGSLPFDHDNIPTLLAMVTKGHYSTPAHVPPDVAHLIARMLTVDPAKRITLPEVRNHIAFRGPFNYFPTETDAHAQSVQSLTQRLRSRQGASALATAVANSKKHKGMSANSTSSSLDRAVQAHTAATGQPSEDDVPLDHAWRKTSTARGSLSSAAGAVGASVGSGSVDDADDVIDEAVLQDLESLGLGAGEASARDELRRRVREQAKEPTLEQAFYKLLRQRKIDRLKQLAVLSPKLEPIRMRRARSDPSADPHEPPPCRL